MLRFIGFYDYTVVLTYLSLISAVTGILLSSRGEFSLAVLCLMVSGVCDAFDGTVARSKKNRTEDEKAFGIQIDSLCDAISFGVFPAMFCHYMGVDGIIGNAVICTYVLCTVIRLAFFNVLEANRQKTEDGCAKYYRGMPVTTVSMILPPVYLTRFFLSPGAFAGVLQGLLAVSALLFVLDVRVPKLNVGKLLKIGK